MASAMRSMSRRSSRYTSWKARRYPPSPATVLTTPSCVLPISTGFTMGPLACSASEAARPSQKYAPESAKAAFTMGGDLRVPCWPPMPVERGFASEKASAGTWQLAHEMVPSRESRASKKSQRPRRTFSGVTSTPRARREVHRHTERRSGERPHRVLTLPRRSGARAGAAHGPTPGRDEEQGGEDGGAGQRPVHALIVGQARPERPLPIGRRCAANGPAGRSSEIEASLRGRGPGPPPPGCRRARVPPRRTLRRPLSAARVPRRQRDRRPPRC